LITGRQEPAIGCLNERATRDGTLRSSPKLSERIGRSAGRPAKSNCAGPPQLLRERVRTSTRRGRRSTPVFNLRADYDSDAPRTRRSAAQMRRSASRVIGQSRDRTSSIGVMPMAAATMQWAANVTSVAKTPTASVRSSSTASQPSKACAAAHYWTSGLRNSDTRRV
jgi:hypothetical protein